MDQHLYMILVPQPHFRAGVSVSKLVDEISWLASFPEYLAPDRWLNITGYASLPKLIFDLFLILIEHHLLRA